MEKWQKTAIEKIRSVIQKKGMSQQQLVREAGFGKSHLNEVLSGKRPLTRQFVGRFAEFVQLETDWFYSDDSAAEPVKIQPDILQAIREGAAVVARESSPDPLEGFTPDQRKLVALIKNLPPARVSSLIKIASLDATAVLSDDEESALGPRWRG